MIANMGLVVPLDGEIAETTVFYDSHARFFGHDVSYD